jgi:hypothetical protein
MARTGMVFVTLFYLPFNHLTRLVAGESFIELSVSHYVPTASGVELSHIALF